MVKQTSDNDQTIIRYLLNELPAEDQARFEEAYLMDGSLFEQVQALEEELIEDYVKGDLSDDERHRFELHYLVSDQRRARIESARQLLQACSLKSPSQTGADDHIDRKLFSFRSQFWMFAKQRLALGFGAAAALSLIIASWLVIEQQRLRGQIASINKESAALVRQAEETERQLVHEREQLTEELKQSIALRDKLEQELARSQALKNQIVFLQLTPGVRNIDKPDRAVISAHTSFVVLRVDLESQEGANQRSYRAVVKTVEGDREIWAQDGIKPQRRKSAHYVVVRAPADRFKTAGAQDFLLTLESQTIGEKDSGGLDGFYFQVTVR